MNLLQVKNYVQKCKKSFEKVKTLFSVDERGVLDGAYFVVCFGEKQLEVSELSPENIGTNFCGVLSNSSSKDWLVRLVRKKAWIQKQIDQLQKDLVSVKKQLANANEEWLWLKEFTVELRFKQLDYGLIQKLKRSSITDRDKTEMSRASIKIIVKPIKEDLL